MMTVSISIGALLLTTTQPSLKGVKYPNPGSKDPNYTWGNHPISIGRNNCHHYCQNLLTRESIAHHGNGMKVCLDRKFIILLLGILMLSPVCSEAAQLSFTGYASWYGEPHRGRLMANGGRFDPGRLTAASWFYPLGTRVRVTIRSAHLGIRHSVTVTITDRGPANHLVQEGRIIDLAHAAFKKLAPDRLGLIPIEVAPVP
jgi:rare lipoprotein A